MARDTWVQSQVESYQRQKMVLDVSLLNTQNYKDGSRVTWSNPGKGVVPSPTPWCSSYRKGAFGSPSTMVANFTFTLFHNHCLVTHSLDPHQLVTFWWPILYTQINLVTYFVCAPLFGDPFFTRSISWWPIPAPPCRNRFAIRISLLKLLVGLFDVTTTVKWPFSSSIFLGYSSVTYSVNASLMTLYRHLSLLTYSVQAPPAGDLFCTRPPCGVISVYAHPFNDFLNLFCTTITVKLYSLRPHDVQNKFPKDPPCAEYISKGALVSIICQEKVIRIQN